MAVVVVLIFGLACGLFLSAANVFLRDIKHLIESALLILFWGSPIVYSLGLVHGILKGNWIEQIYLCNPMTIAIVSFQKAMWIAGSNEDNAAAVYWPPDLALRLAIMGAVGLLLVWAAQRFFARLEGSFAQEL
jgi:ABC-2 type transport system permease protein